MSFVAVVVVNMLHMWEAREYDSHLCSQFRWETFNVVIEPLSRLDLCDLCRDCSRV